MVIGLVTALGMMVNGMKVHGEITVPGVDMVRGVVLVPGLLQLLLLLSQPFMVRGDMKEVM